MLYYRCFIYPIIAILLFSGSLWSKTIFRPIERVPLADVNKENFSGRHRFISGVSSQNLLGLDRRAPFALPTAKRGVPLGASVMVDTLNVLALKVEFQRETPDDPNTTGEGIFDLRSYEQFLAEEEHYIDPAPHTTSYFDSHMEALRRYWYFISDRKLDLTWDVYPREESLAYRLEQPMSYYGSAATLDEIAEKLGYFFIDAVTMADSVAPQIDFSQYQSIILFHAGSDQQNNIPFINNTPHDLFTGFLILSDPIYVDGGAVGIREGLIVPEMASQDNRVTAINAVLAHEFGHQLGLVDLYNTQTFFTQVGDFALMDNNGMSVGVQFPDIRSTVGGTLPVYASAWSRAFLGFDIPREITSGIDITLTAAALSDDSTEIIKVPMTDFEYLLLENRQPDVDTLEPGYPFDNVLIGDSLTGVILGPGYAYFEGNDTVLVSDAEYDRLLPGDGVLIWHVDEYVAYQSNFPGFNNYQTNSLQWDKDRRFITLVEANGVIDFGGNYYRGYGADSDFFKVGNNTSLTPFSNPPSRSNLGADTHIHITDISHSDTVMTLDVDIEWLLPGWPQMSFPQQNSDPVLVDIDGDDAYEILVAADSTLLIYRQNGEKFIANSDSVRFYGFDGSIQTYPWGIAAACDTTISDRPVPVDFDGDGTFEIALATASGRLYAFGSSDDDLNGRADALPGFPVQISDQALTSLIAVGFDSFSGMELIVFDGTGTVHAISEFAADSVLFDFGESILSSAAYTVEGYNIIDVAYILDNQAMISRLISDAGALEFRLDFSTQVGTADTCFIASGDIDRDGGRPEIIAVCSSRIMLVEEDGSIETFAEIGQSLGRPALGDINADGYSEIIVAGDSKIYSFAYNGALLSDFPIDLGRYDLTGVIAAQPVLADVDDNGSPDIIVGLPVGAIHAYDHRADRIAGFPLPSSFEIERSCAIADIDNDGDLDLLSVEKSGMISAWDISYIYNSVNVPWGMDGGDQSNSNYLSPLHEKQLIAGDEQLPKNSVYNYPNPASNSTIIRYYLKNESLVKIDMYDFMGENIESVQMIGNAHTDNEYVWDCSGVASGVYFCRVEADDGDSKKWQIIKIALVK